MTAFAVAQEPKVMHAMTGREESREPTGLVMIGEAYRWAILRTK